VRPPPCQGDRFGGWVPQLVVLHRAASGGGGGGSRAGELDRAPGFGELDRAPERRSRPHAGEGYRRRSGELSRWAGAASPWRGGVLAVEEPR
jgi:hypothetical protein